MASELLSTWSHGYKVSKPRHCCATRARMLRVTFSSLRNLCPPHMCEWFVAETIPDALLTECSKCSEIQKTQAGVVMAFIQLHHRDMWDGILNKYDPDNTFRKKYLIENDDDDYEDEKNGA